MATGVPAPSNRPAETVAKTGLRGGAIGLSGVLMQSITTIAPAVGLLFSIQYIASLAGIVSPLAFVISFLIMVTLALSVTQLAKHLPSAGGYYTYVSKTIGPRVGFISSWLFFLYIPTSMIAAPVFTAGVIHTELVSQYSVNVPWWLIYLVIMAVVCTMIYRGIALSTQVMMTLGLAEIAIITLLALWGVIDPGHGGATLSPFNPSLVSTHGLYLAVVFSIFSYVGWEAAAPLAEETKSPRTNIPKALVYSVIIMALFFTFGAYGLETGWGTARVAGFASAAQLPAFTLARHFWGAAWVVVLLAVLNSTMALSIAAANATTRMWFAMARSGSLPRQLARVHRRYDTPSGAIITATALLVPIGLILGLWLGTENQYFLIGLMTVIAAAWTYIMGNIGVARLYLGERRADFRFWLHLLFPILSSAALVWVVVKSVDPLPAGAEGWAPVVCGVWFAIGALILWAMRRLGREGWLLRAGQIAAEHDTPAATVRGASAVVPPGHANEGV
jgi:amino acid transporter